MSLTQTVKLPTWKPQLIPLSEEEREWMRGVVTRAVFSVWNRYGRPTDLAEIYQYYLKQASEGWHFDQERNYFRLQPSFPQRGKRTVDRRVNEAASKQFGAKVVAVTSGIYQPSPRLFLNEEKAEK